MNGSMDRHETKRLGLRALATIAALAILAAPVAAQNGAAPVDTMAATNGAPSLMAPSGQPLHVIAPNVNPRTTPRPILVSYFRPHDSRGINVFEAPKVEGVPYTGFQMQIGAAFTQQFQSLKHKNTASPVTAANTLVDIGPGFNNADANLFVDAQLAKAIRVELTSYLSSRHHNETWVKDGYLLIDGSPWENPLLDNIMKNLTLRLGHFEINYGDAHFRSSDNGRTMFNPLVGNLIMNAFTTEIGGEAYYRQNGFLAMACATGGEVRGTVTKPDSRSPSYIGKIGYDNQLSKPLRVRLTGSVYSTSKSINNTLYSGSRAGSRYFWVLENTAASETGNAWSGDLQPGFGHKVTAWVVNPFVKFEGLELWGNVEQAKGRATGETSDRTWKQYAGEGTYRFLKDMFYVAARYNEAKGTLQGVPGNLKIDRFEGGGGWFLTTNLEAKIEYVKQQYKGFPLADIHHGGEFHGIMFESAVQF